MAGIEVQTGELIKRYNDAQYLEANKSFVDMWGADECLALRDFARTWLVGAGTVAFTATMRYKDWRGIFGHSES